jgi:hypothetical protein
MFYDKNKLILDKKYRQLFVVNVHFHCNVSTHFLGVNLSNFEVAKQSMRFWFRMT